MRKFLIKSLIVATGMFVYGLGFNLIIIANIGSDPVNCAIIGLHSLFNRFWETSFGVTQIIFNVTLVLVGGIIDKSKISFGTIIASFSAGWFIDLFNPLVAGIFTNEVELTQGIILVITGCLINSIGIAIYMSANFGLGSGEILVKIISERKNWEFKYVRIGEDTIFLLTGVLLGAPLGVGTIIGICLMGPLIQRNLSIFNKVSSKLLSTRF